MNRSQFYILFLAILLIIDTGINIYYDIKLIGWTLVVSWIGNCLNIIAALLDIIAVSRNSGPVCYHFSLILLVFGNFISLLLFFFVKYNGRFYFIKIASIALITSLISLIQIYLKRFPYMQELTRIEQQQLNPQMEQQQPLYQPENEPNVEPIDINIQQPQNESNVTPSEYQKPQFDVQATNEDTAPLPNFQQPQCQTVLENNSPIN